MTATIQRDDLVASVADALQFISYYHPADYLRHLALAYEREQSPAAKDAIAQILTNSRMCAEGHRPICQDTGIVNAFVKIGMDVRWAGFANGESLEDAINEGVRRGYNFNDNKLRASIVADPLFERKNTRDNTPAVVHVQMVPGNRVDVTVAAKGGGSENKSKFVMLNPSDSLTDWVLRTVPIMGAGWCPPGMLGLGIGGTAEKAMLMAKESLMAPLDMTELLERGPRDRVEELRIELYDKINALGIGAQGLGGLTTVLDVKIMMAPTHAASLPVGMIPNCAATRHAHFTLDGSGAAVLDPTAARRLAGCRLVARCRALETRESRHAHASGSRFVETRPDVAPFRQNADRPRRRPQAHRRHAFPWRTAAGRFHQSRHLLRRPGRSGAG